MRKKTALEEVFFAPSIQCASVISSRGPSTQRFTPTSSSQHEYALGWSWCGRLLFSLFEVQPRFQGRAISRVFFVGSSGETRQIGPCGGSLF